MSKLATAFFLAVFGLVALQDVQAQGTQIELGPRIGFDIGGDVEELFLGADARIGLATLPVLINPTFDYYFVEEDFSFFQFSVNALYEFGIDNQTFTPYAGGGLGISRISVDIDDGVPGVDIDADDTDTGLNLIGGARFSAGNLTPFAQAQITFGDIDLFTIGGGLLFRIGP